MQSLKYFPFTSLVETSFWDCLIKKKIDEYKLNNEPINIIGFFKIDCSASIPSLLSLNYDSFSTNIKEKNNEKLLYGKLIMFNSLEEFINEDKKKLIQKEQTLIWNDLKNKSIENLNLTELLAKFILLTFVDIKKYKVYYWFSFPAFNYPDKTLSINQPLKVEDYFEKTQLKKINDLYFGKSNIDKTYFLISSSKNNLSIHDIKDFEKLNKENEKIYFCFSDPSTRDEYPGWILRNFLAFFYMKYNLKKLDIISFRIRSNSINQSLLYEVVLDNDIISNDNFVPDIVGFERNEKNKLTPKVVDLSANMDPKKLIDSAVNLNLKLMRWRLMPNLNLEKISSTKCLLLGSGTLGCNVARCLIGWGVQNITFVDNGTVSYSNPVRQSLFEYTDSLFPAKNKSDAARDALKRINPNLNSQSYCLNIPMPGHFVGPEMKEKTKKDVELLEKLIDENDCIFLLMDTRESRWLPTVICHTKKKIVINAALGFDTYLVQRHGYTNEKLNNDEELNTINLKKLNKINGSKLGCYYCNDVVAPGDSTKNRTLDQQCTVTRPGVSMIAASLAVELMVSIVQHDLGIDAPAYLNFDEIDEETNTEIDSSLGLIPHQIRGFLSQFNQVLPTCLSYKNCTACSSNIIKSYKDDGFDFLYTVFNDCSYLEEISGLKTIQDQADLIEVWELTDDE